MPLERDFRLSGKLPIVEKMLYFLNESFWESPLLVVLFTATLFVIVLIRYLASAYLYALAMVRWIRKRPIEGNRHDLSSQKTREIGWSTLSSLLFAFLATLSYFAYQHGRTKVYTDMDEYGAAYFFLTIIILLFLYETYYYWLHRWMHRPGVFRIVHKVHHESIHTSVFTSFSFHPIEAFLQFLFIPAVIMVIPVHYVALGIVLLLMTVSAVINHAGVEIYPKGFCNHPVGRWLIGATHHDIHHKNFRTNYGLYFTFWDRWMKTESAKYPEEFHKNTR